MSVQAGDAVWIPVLPSMKDFGPTLENGIAGSVQTAGGKAGGLFSGGFLGKLKTGITGGIESLGISGGALFAGGVAAGVVGIGKTLYGVGAVFDDLADTIRIGTGATGEALDDLVDSSKRIAQQIPVDIEKIGPAVADLNTRLGLTGDNLETVAMQVLEAGRILDEDVDINKVTAAFQAFGLEQDEIEAGMDTLFRVSQDTGVSMNTLAGIAQSSAPALQSLGFGFEESVAMMGAFDKAGLNVNQISAAMTRSLVNLAKDGEAPQEAFNRVTSEIEGFIAEGNEAAALDLAGQVFGTRGAAQFVAAVESGTISLDDLSAAAVGSGDTIMQASEDTADFSEQWQLFKNNVLVALEPVASAVFSGIGELMEWLNTDVFPAMGRAWDTYVQPVWDVFYEWVVVKLAPAIKSFWEDTIKPAWDGISKAIGFAWDNVIGPALRALWGFINDPLIPLITYLWEKVIEPVFRWAGEKIAAFWTATQPILKAFKQFLDGDIMGALDSLWTGVKNVFGWIAETVGGVLVAPVNFVIGTIWNDGIVAVVNMVSDALGLSWKLQEGALLQPFFSQPNNIGAGGGGGSARPVAAYARGGLAKRGWALVGEEGPELVNFSDPGRVYTAAQTAAALAAGEDLPDELARRAVGRTPAESLVPAGGNLIWDALSGAAKWVGDTVGGAVDTAVSWVRGGLAAAAEFVLNPIKSMIFDNVSKFGTVGQIMGGAGNKAIDSVISWIRGKDREYNEEIATTGPVYDGVVSGNRARPSRGPITSRYGPRWGSFHAGIDIAGGGPTYAAMDGKVSKVAWNAVSGRTGIGIILNHGKNGWTYYGHNPSMNLPARVGANVKAGQHIGYQGATGNVTGTHLHFEWWPGAYGRAVNPQALGVFDRGGWLMPGAMAANLGSRPEAVLTPAQSANLMRLADRSAMNLDGVAIEGTLEIGGDGLGRLMDAHLVQRDRRTLRRVRAGG